MPCISRFYGVSVYMYYRDHEPAHFHAIYGEFEAEFEIESMLVSEGWLPRRAHTLVAEWGAAHRDELRQNWDRARSHQLLTPVPPLD